MQVLPDSHDAMPRSSSVSVWGVDTCPDGCQDCQVLRNSQYLLVCAGGKPPLAEGTGQSRRVFYVEKAAPGSLLCSLCVPATCPPSLKLPSTVPSPSLGSKTHTAGAKGPVDTCMLAV